MAAMTAPVMMRGVLYGLAAWVKVLNQDVVPRLAAASGSVVLLTKVLLVISTASSTKLS